MPTVYCTCHLPFLKSLILQSVISALNTICLALLYILTFDFAPICGLGSRPCALPELLTRDLSADDNPQFP